MLNEIRWEEMEAYLLQALEANKTFGGSVQVEQIARTVVERLASSQQIREHLVRVEKAREALVDKFEEEVQILDDQVDHLQSNCSHPALDVGQCFSTCQICGKVASIV